MHLVEYLAGARDAVKRQYSESFPPALELPSDFTKQLRNLYKAGENNGCEFGQTAFFRATHHGVELSDIVKGGADNVQCPQTIDPDEFGDLHSHPSMSIGHVNGFSAHSLQDYKVFQHHLNKPVFIRFVSSGKWLYAVVYRQGLSQYAADFIDERIRKHNADMADYFNRRSPVGDQMTRLASEMENTPLAELLGPKQKIAATRPEMRAQRKAFIERQILEWKKQTPNFGEFLMQASIGYNTLMACHKRYGFYSSLNSDTLTLQAGPKGI